MRRIARFACAHPLARWSTQKPVGKRITVNQELFKSACLQCATCSSARSFASLARSAALTRLLAHSLSGIFCPILRCSKSLWRSRLLPIESREQREHPFCEKLSSDHWLAKSIRFARKLLTVPWPAKVSVSREIVHGSLILNHGFLSQARIWWTLAANLITFCPISGQQVRTKKNSWVVQH